MYYGLLVTENEWEWERDAARWTQFYEILRDRIVRGVYQPRYPIPSLKQLEQEFALARNTIIKALSRLRREGYIRTVHGVGTFVRPKDDWGQEESATS